MGDMATAKLTRDGARRRDPSEDQGADAPRESEERVIVRRTRDAERLESLGLLASGIAHDFNSILMAVSTHAEIALEDLPADAPARANVEQIRRAAERAADLCQQLMTYAGRRAPATKPADLSELARDVVRLLRVRIPAAVELELELEERLPRVVIDEVQIRQVLMNLLTNAAQAIGDRAGRITIRTGVAWMEVEELEELQLGADLSPGRYAWCSVEDDGCGMDEVTKARIFDPFFTTRPSGRGLGLATVLGIVRGHRGALDVTSAPGRGTTFRVLLPCNG